MPDLAVKAARRLAIGDRIFEKSPSGAWKFYQTVAKLEFLRCGVHVNGTLCYNAPDAPVMVAL